MAKLRAAEVDPRFKICCDANSVLRKINTDRISDRFETNKRWAPIQELHVPFVSKRSDKKKTIVVIFRDASDFL